MNRHFEDARYYLKRAGQTAVKGLKAELTPVETRLRRMTGREKEPEPGRVESVKRTLETLPSKAEHEAKVVFEDVRGKVKTER